MNEMKTCTFWGSFYSLFQGSNLPLLRIGYKEIVEEEICLQQIVRTGFKYSKQLITEFLTGRCEFKSVFSGLSFGCEHIFHFLPNSYLCFIHLSLSLSHLMSFLKYFNGVQNGSVWSPLIYYCVDYNLSNLI